MNGRWPRGKVSSPRLGTCITLIVQCSFYGFWSRTTGLEVSCQISDCSFAVILKNLGHDWRLEVVPMLPSGQVRDPCFHLVVGPLHLTHAAHFELEVFGPVSSLRLHFYLEFPVQGVLDLGYWSFVPHFLLFRRLSRPSLLVSLFVFACIEDFFYLTCSSVDDYRLPMGHVLRVQHKFWDPKSDYATACLCIVYTHLRS